MRISTYRLNVINLRYALRYTKAYFQWKMVVIVYMFHIQAHSKVPIYYIGGEIFKW